MTPAQQYLAWMSPRGSPEPSTAVLSGRYGEATAAIFGMVATEDIRFEPGPDRTDAVYLDELRAEPCGHGAGRALMRFICDEADRRRIVLFLACLASRRPGSLDQLSLMCWYQRLGFRYNMQGYMVRHPQAVSCTDGVVWC